MDFTKFVDLLERRALFFCRSDRFEDPFEGSVSPLNAPALQAATRTALAPHISDPQQLEHFVSSIVSSDTGMRKLLRPMTYINCWHMNDCESAAMWKLYSKMDDSIAVLATLGDLKKSFSVGDNRQVIIGAVNYIDYNRELVPNTNGFTPFFYKRISFRHEQELRAIIIGETKVVDGKVVEVDLPGELVEIDLEALVCAVYISPTCAGWFAELVRNVVKRYGLNVPVHKSELSIDPIF